MDVIATVSSPDSGSGEGAMNSISSVSRLLLACLNRLTFGSRIALTSLDTI